MSDSRQMREVEAKGTPLLASSGKGIWGVDLEGRCTFINPAGAAMIGYRPEDVVGKPLHALMHPAHPNGSSCSPEACEISQALKADRNICVENGMLWRKDGTCFPAAISIYPISDQTGVVIGTVVTTTDLTEQKRTQEALTLFRSLIDQTHDGIEVIDPATGRFLDVNERACRAHGYTREEYLALTVPQIDPLVAAQPWEDAKTAVQRVGFRVFESLHRRKDGTVFPVEVNVTYVRLEREYFLAVVRDITERKRAEAVLRDSEERFRQLAEHVSQVFWMTSLDKGAIHYISPAYASVWGRSCDSLYAAPRSWLDAIHPDDRARVRVAAHTQQTIGRYHEEYRIVRPDGTIRWIEDRGFPVQDASGITLRIVGVSTDITERKEAEEALRQSIQQFSGAFESAAIGMALVAPDGRWLKVNRALCDLTGYSAEELAQKTFQDITHPDDLDQGLAYVRQMLAGEIRSYQMEKRYVHKQGHIVWILLSVSLLRDAKSTPVHFIAQIQDLSERKRIEGQLRQAAKMEAVERLAGGIAHEFNNLLTVINGYSETLLHRLVQEHPLRRYPEEIKRAGERAATLTHQLLAFSQQQVLQPTILDINVVVVELQGLLQQLIGEQIALKVRVPPVPCWVRADKGQLEQVFVNLAAHARDTMPQGGRLAVQTVEMRAGAAPETPLASTAEPVVHLTVSDTGLGMDAETAQHIFDPFFTTKALGHGTGLGLAIVHGIITQSDGTIAIDSVPGLGTTFTITLPLCPPPSQPPTLQSMGDATGTGTATIVLVEDETLVRELIQEALKVNGYHVVACSNGEDALRALADARNPVHLLLTDVVMPGMNGRELAVKAHAQCPSLKVLFMSGYTDDLALHRRVSAAQWPYLQKPFPMATLLTIIREVLAQEGPSRSS